MGKSLFFLTWKCNEGMSHGRGSAPHGHWFGQPPVGGVQIGLFKTTRPRSRSLFLCSWTFFLLSQLALQCAQGWPGTAGLSPWNQPSEEVQDRAKAVTSRNQQHQQPWFQHGSPVTSRNSDASQQSFPEQHVETHVRNETKVQPA